MCGLFDGGTGGIRTLGSLLSYVPLAREYFRPLSHRSVNQFGRGRFGTQGNKLVKYVLHLEEKFFTQNISRSSATVSAIWSAAASLSRSW